MRAGGLARVVFDARCLQDTDYARRGVGRHVLGLLEARPAGVWLVGLVDGRLPAPIPEAARWFDEVVPNAYMAHRPGVGAGVGAYVSPSPMTHDGTFGARFMADPRVLHAAVVYDFIPHDFPERYLATTRDRVAYATQLRWLAGADLFAATSASSAADLVRVLGVDPGRVVVTGAPMTRAFVGEGGAARGHVLVVGGGDARKNPETVVVAHARAASLQGGRVRLVVAGGYGAEAAAALKQLAAANGGDAGLVEVPGLVEDAALDALYLGARIVVCASLAEGFSIPVVEGMAAGALVLASDIPAHAELVEDAGRRFPAEDAGRLTRLLEDWWGVGPEAGLEEVLAGQLAVSGRFGLAAVGERFWGPLLAGLAGMPAAPAVARGARAQVAIMTPLPPDRSGVADYTAAACAALGQLVDLHGFTPTARPGLIPGMASMRPLSALPAVLPGFDAAVAVVGNSHFHTEIFRHALEYGGGIVAHDARMLGFYRVVMGEERALAEASRELGRAVEKDELATWLQDERALKALFLGEMARAGAPMMVHSPVTHQLVQERYGVVPAYLPFSIYRPWEAGQLTAGAREAARARLGVGPGEVLLASFGHVHESKAPQECIWALSTLRDWGVAATLAFVGATLDLPDGGVSLMELAARLGVSAHVRLFGDFLGEGLYQDYLVAADVGIQLRTYGLGGLSGAVLDCAAAGLPAVVNRGLFDAVLPPEGYTRVIPDALSPLLLAEAVAEVVESGLARARREEERRAFSEARSMGAYARRMCEALELGAGELGGG